MIATTERAGAARRGPARGVVRSARDAVIRVAFVDQSGDAIGGAERSLAALLRGLPSQIQPIPVLFGDGAFAQLLRERGLPVEIVPLPKALLAARREGNGSGGALARAPGAVFGLAARLRALRVDVVHTNTIKAHALAGPAARLAGVPVVAHLRDILQGVARTAVRTVLASCTQRQIAISHAVRRAYALDATVIPNPLEPEAFAEPEPRGAARQALGLPASVPLITIVGRINRWKGHDRFLRVAAALRELPPVHAVVVGAPIFRDADFVEELHDLAHGLGIADRVHWLPWLDDPRDAYAASDVVCNCSDDEPFGRTLIEAAAAGIPTVCFAGGGVDEAVIDGVTGSIVPRADERAFADAVAGYLRDPALRARIGAAARHAARRFDPATHGASVAGVLHAAVS